jgi:hypothetical protein
MLLAGFTLLACLVSAAACGRLAKRNIDSESHFLATCENSCADGASCVCGVCTLLCAEPADCQSLSPSASCRDVDVGECAGTPSSGPAAPLAARICDVVCAADADCADLSAEHRCQSGHCRLGTTRLESSASSADAAPPVVEGEGEASTAPELSTEPTSTEPFSPLSAPLPLSCEQFRDQAPGRGISIHIRNERSSLIYVQQFKDRPGNCAEPFRFTQVERDGVDVDRVGTACFASCDRVISSPEADIFVPCTQPRCDELSIPLPPGGETSEYIDRVWTTVGLPLECLRRPIDTPGFVGLPECKIEGPVLSGVYTLHALAFTEVQPQPTSCTPSSLDEEGPAACFLGIPGTELRADATTSLLGEVSVNGDVSEVTLVFRDTPGGPDAGASGAP